MNRTVVFLLLILTIYTLLAVATGAQNPIFEAPDEIWHYFTAQTIAETGKLPIVTDEPDLWMSQEAAQPPLYYMLAATLIRPLDTADSRQLVWPNPRVQLGDASSPTNINAFVHTSDEAWPWHGHVLGAHLSRLLSTLFGLGTLLCIYGSARLVWSNDPRTAVLATALVAFLPQFIFLNASVSNDPAIVFFSAAALWQLLFLWYEKASWFRLLLLGLTIGLAILSKITGLLLLAYSVGFLLIVALRDRKSEHPRYKSRVWITFGCLVVAVALLISGWLLWRNWQLYGDFTAINQNIRFFGGSRNYNLAQVLSESSGLWTSLFAIFGWFNVRPPQWVFILWNGLVLIALLGIVLQLFRQISDPERMALWKLRLRDLRLNPLSWLNWPALPACLLGIWVLIVYIALIRFMMQARGGQGRLLFPALLPLALGLAYGLTRYRWKGTLVVAPLLALITALYSVFVVVPKAYSLPLLLAETAIPAEGSRVEFDVGQGIELIAASVETEEAVPDDWVWLTLYWQANQEMAIEDKKDSPEFVLELLGQDDELVGKLQSYHGRGLYPASLWQPGQVVVDRIAVHLDEEMMTPALVRLNVKLAGEIPSVDVGAIKVEPSEWPEPATSSLAHLGGIELVETEFWPKSATPGETVDLSIRWQIDTAPDRDLTTFVHLGEMDKPPLAQGDSPPLGGDYPTRLWAAGEVISDSYSLAIPEDIDPGSYPIYLGLYDPTNNLRVPLEIDGERQPGDAYLVGWLTILQF